MTTDRDTGRDDLAPSLVDRDDEQFASRVLQSFREIFWEPEVARRGGLEATGPIYAALAILAPGLPVEVRLNEEVKMTAHARADATVASGTAVTAENIDDVEVFEPLDVDPNAGWVAWLILPNGHEYARFDFIRNRGRSLQLLQLAREFLETAREADAAGRAGPAVENAFAAAELAITAQAYSFDTEEPQSGRGRRSHSSRQHWTKVQVGLRNTTADAHRTLITLHGLRGPARYGEGVIDDTAAVRQLVAAVGELVADAETRVGPLMRSLDLSKPESEQASTRPD